MTDHRDDELLDDELLAELRLMSSRLDPVPADVVVAARAAIIWRTIDAELAELTADSVVDADRLVGVRAREVPTTLTFEVGDQVLELEVIPTGALRRILGQLVPAEPGAVVIRHGGGETAVDADEVGRFSVEEIVPGPVRVRWQVPTASGNVAESDWFLV